MANIMQDGSYVLSDRTEALKGFEQELEAAHSRKIAERLAVRLIECT